MQPRDRLSWQHYKLKVRKRLEGKRHLKLRRKAKKKMRSRLSSTLKI